VRYRIENQDGRRAGHVDVENGDLIAMRDAFANMFDKPMRDCILRGSINKQEDGKTRIVPRDAKGKFLLKQGKMVFFIATPHHDGHGT
jgi:hypothetical protein